MRTVVPPFVEYDDLAGRAIYELENAIDDLREACEKDLDKVREGANRVRGLLAELCRIDALVNPMDTP